MGERLRAVFQTANRVTLPVSGTGSAGMECCLVNLLEPGDTAVVGVNGYFGERLCEVARRIGADVVRVEGEWGKPLDPERLLEAQRSTAGGRARLVAVVHAETSTGVRNDVAPLRALQETDTLFVLDTVTSLGGIPVEIDAWGVDAAYSATQKCLGAVSGLAPVTFSERALARVAGRPGGQAGRLVLPRRRPPRRLRLRAAPLPPHRQFGAGGRPPRRPRPAPRRRSALGVGTAPSRRRAAPGGVAGAGLRAHCAGRDRLPQLTATRLPAGTDDGKTRRRLRDEFGIEVGGGLGPFAGQAWRIGLMGQGARERSVATLLGALRVLLG